MREHSDAWHLCRKHRCFMPVGHETVVGLRWAKFYHCARHPTAGPAYPDDPPVCIEFNTGLPRMPVRLTQAQALAIQVQQRSTSRASGMPTESARPAERVQRLRADVGAETDDTAEEASSSA